MRGAGRNEFGIQSSRSPGPGAYEQNSSIGKDGPLFSMKGKTKTDIKRDVPGPGAYEA